MAAQGFLRYYRRIIEDYREAKYELVNYEVSTPGSHISSLVSQKAPDDTY